MAFRKTGLCRLITLVLTLCMLACAASAALSESEMTEEQITALEEMTGLYIFRLIDLSCSVPSVRIDPGVNPVVEEYCKLHQKYLEVERLFGIEAKD